MAGFVNTEEQAILDHYFGGSALSAAPGTWHVALFTTMPADDGTGGVEVTGGSYGRQAVTNNATEFPAATGANPSKVENANAITFATATADWGTVLGYGLYDSSSGGTLYWFDVFSTSVVVSNGKTFSIAANDLNLELGDPGDTYSS